MSIKATPELNNLLFVLIGERLLQADEDLAYASRRPYHRLADRLTDLSGEIEQSVVGISRSLPPKVGASYLQSMKLFIDNGGTNHLRDFSDQLKTIGDGRTDTSMNIIESKWQIIAELIRLMIELLVIFVMSFFSGGASASDAAVAKARSRVVLLTVLDTLLKRTHLMPSLSEAFQEAFQTFAVRLALMMAGPDGRRPKGFDWKAIAQDGVFGAFAGLFHGAFSSGLGKLLKNFTGKGPVKNLTKDVTDKAPRPSKFSPKNLANTALNDTKDFLTSGGSEAVAEIVAGGLMTGNWTTSWDTFLGSGISSKAEHLLGNGASKPGTWVKNNFTEKNVPTSSQADGDGAGSKSGSGTDSGTGNGTNTGNTATTGAGTGAGTGTGTGTGAGGGSGSGKNGGSTNGAGSQSQTDSTQETEGTQETGATDESGQTGNDEHTGPASKSPSSGSSGPSGSNGPATKGSVNTSSNGDHDYTAPTDDTDDTDDTNAAEEESQQTPDERTVPPTHTDSRGGPTPNHNPAPAQGHRTPDAQQDEQQKSGPESEQEAGTPPTQPNTQPDSQNDSRTDAPENESETEPSTGLLTEDGSSDNEQSPSDAGSPSTSQAAPHTVTRPEHQLWSELLGTPGPPSQQLLDDIAARRRGAVPSPEEIDLRRELRQKLNDTSGGVTIFIDDAANFGHQAAATMLMDSLNELGHQGPITAIAPANVQQKLQLLLSDELNSRVTWQTQTFDPDRPASDPRAAGQPGTQGLVMVAASDRLDGDEEVAERFLNFLGADRAIVLKPYAWGTSHRYLYSRPSPDSGVVVTDLEGSESSGNTIAPDALFNFHTPLLTHDELNDLIDRRVTATDVADGLKEIVRAVHENGTEVMPVYGLHNVTESGRVSALSTLAAGISSSGIGKPSVILSFGRTTVDFAPVHTNAQLSRTDITAPDLREQLERLGPDDVLVVQSAGLPQDVFRQVFQLGTLPAVLEGANTTNLMQLLGRPYFSALTNHTPYDQLDGVAASHLEQVTKAITHPSQWGRRAAKLTSEQPTPAWKALQNVHTAQSVASALPRDGEGHVLTQDEWVRLKADGVLSVAELKSVLGDGADVVAMIADVGYTGRTATISNEQLATLQTRLGELRAGHLVKVRSAMDHLSVVPEAGATEVVAEAIAELTQTGSRLHNYFAGLRAKAHDPDNDQTLQALRLVLTDRPALPRTESLAQGQEGNNQQETPRWQTDWDRVDDSDDESEHSESSGPHSVATSSRSTPTSSRSQSPVANRPITESRQQNTTEAESESEDESENENEAAIADTGGDNTSENSSDFGGDIDFSFGFFGDTGPETTTDNASGQAVKPSDITDSSETPPRLVLRSARSADDATTDSDDIVKQTVATGSSDSSLLASYTPSDWADRNERYNTVIASDTFQDHHHSESSMYRKQRRTPWSGQKVSFFAAHGTPTRVKLTRQDGTTIVVSGRELGRYLEHSAALGPKDRPIVLYACSTGASPTHGGLSVAQHVANVTGRPVYAPTTSTGTALDSEQRPRPVLFRDDAENSGQWITYTPEPSGAELLALARTAGLHPPAGTTEIMDTAAGTGSTGSATTSEDAPGPWVTTRTLQLVRTLRGTFGTQIGQSPDHDALLAALGALDSERFGGDDTVWAPFRDGRMTPDLLRRITEELAGRGTPGLDRYAALFDRVNQASGGNGPAAGSSQDDLQSPSRDLTRDVIEPAPAQQTQQTQQTQETQQVQQASTSTDTDVSTDVVRLVAAQLDTDRPARVDDNMRPAPARGAVQRFPGDLTLPTYITGDGVDDDSAFTYGQSQVIQRGIGDVLRRIAGSALPVPARDPGAANNPLAELEQALKQTPHLFHGDGWVSAPFKDTSGRIRQLRVSQRPQAPWSMITNEKGGAISLDPVKVDQIHRSQITSGKSETASSSRQLGVAVPLGPPIGPASMFGRVGLTLGFTKSVDFNLQDQTLSQAESRHSDESHLYLGDVMYTVELTDPAPEKYGKLKRITERISRPLTRSTAPVEDTGPQNSVTFGVKDGLLLRLPDNLTANRTHEHAPQRMRLGEHSDYRMVHTEGYGSVAEIQQWAVDQAGAVVGSSMHAEITRFFSSENFIRTADRMAHGTVTSQPMFTESGQPGGVFAVDKIVPVEATQISETDAAELRNAIQRVIKNDRSTSTAYSQDLQFTVGPSISFDEYATSSAQPRLQVGGFAQFGNRSTRTTGFGGSGSRKIVGRAKKVRTELYLVKKTVHVRKSGQDRATEFDVWTLDRMTRAEARRLAGWDDGTKLRTRSAEHAALNSAQAEGDNGGSSSSVTPVTPVPPNTGEPPAPVYLPQDHPTLLGMARVEAFLPDTDTDSVEGAATDTTGPPTTPPATPPAAQPATPPPAAFLNGLTDSVIAAIAQQHPGLVAPLADFTTPDDKAKGWRGKNHFSAALQNTLSVMDALSHHSVAGQLESFTTDGIPIRLVDTTGTKRKYRWIRAKGELTGRRYEGTRNELILRSSTPGTQRLDSSATVSHTREFGVDVGVSARENNADAFKQPINSGVITPAGRFGWQKARKTGSGATVSYEPLHATSGPSHVFSYQLSVTVTSGGYWRFREPLRVLGVLGTGLSVGRNAEVDLIGGTARRPAVTGRILLDVPDEHIPPTARRPRQEQVSTPPAAAPVAVTLNTEDVQKLLGEPKKPLVATDTGRGTGPEANAQENTGENAEENAEGNVEENVEEIELLEREPAPTPFGDLPHQVIAVAGGSELSQGVETALKEGSGDAWQFSLYGAAPHDAVMRQFQPQVLASFLDQSISRAGMRMVELFGAGPYVNRIGRLVHRVTLRNPVVQSKPVAVETEVTLGAETQVTHARTSVTVAKLNLGVAYARSHDQGPSLVGTYGLVLNGTWTKGSTATATNTVSVENDRDDENLKYLVTADVDHEVGFTTRANGLAGPLRALLPTLRTHFAGFTLTMPGGWLGHVPEKVAHRLGLVGSTLPAAPTYSEDAWSPSPWLKDTPFGSFPVNSLDSSAAARHFAELLKSRGVDDAGRDHILDMMTPRALLALRQQMAAAKGGVTAVTRTAWTRLGEVSIGSQRATVRIELIPGDTTFDGIDHSVTFQETLGMTETVEVNRVKAVTTTTGLSVTEAVRTHNTVAPTAGPSLSESLAVTQQKTAATSASRMKNYTFYPNEPFADFLTTYRIRMVLVNADGTEVPSQDFTVGTLREQLPLSLAVPNAAENTGGNLVTEGNQPPRVTVRRPGQLTNEAIERWRREGQTQAFTMPANGFMPRRITDTDMALDAAHLALAKAHNTDLPHLPKPGSGTVELSGTNLAAATGKARKSGLARQGRASGQALSDGLASTQTAAFFGNTTTGNGYLAATMHDATIALDTQGSYRLFSRPRLSEATLLSVAADATMESPERQTVSSDLSVTETGAQGTTLGAAVGTSVPSVGTVSPGPTGSGGNTGESTTLKLASADGTQQNIKPKTGRALLFSIPTDWLGEATVTHGRAASVFVRGSRSQTVEYRTNVLAWVREDVARDLGLIDDTNFPSDVTAAWTSVTKASKAWVDADKAYWKIRRAVTESAGDADPTSEQVEQMAVSAARAHAAMREFRRVRAATDRLTQWYHRTPRSGPKPPAVSFTAPETPSTTFPKYTGTAFTPDPATAAPSIDAPHTLVSPDGETYTLHNVPEDGDAFYHALAAGMRHTNTTLPGATGSAADTTPDVTDLRNRLTDTLTNDSGDLLDFMTPDLLDRFDPEELANGGPTFAPGSPEAHEFEDDAHTLPLYARLSAGERRALALAQLQRAGNSGGERDWNHGAADLLPALAARTLGVKVTVVRDDGTFQDFEPGNTGTPPAHVVLYLKDRHYQAALAPVPAASETNHQSESEDDSEGLEGLEDHKAPENSENSEQENDGRQNDGNVQETEADAEDDDQDNDGSASEAGNDGDSDTSTSTTPPAQRTKRIHKRKSPEQNDDSTTDTDTEPVPPWTSSVSTTNSPTPSGNENTPDDETTPAPATTASETNSQADSEDDTTSTDDDSASETGYDGDNDTNASTMPPSQRVKHIRKRKSPKGYDGSTTDTEPTAPWTPSVSTTNSPTPSGNENTPDDETTPAPATTASETNSHTESRTESERDTTTDDESASEAGNDGDNETNTSTTPLAQRTKRIHKSKPPARNDDSTTDTETGTDTGTDAEADPESTPSRTHTEDDATDGWVTEHDYGPLSDGSSLPPAPPPTPVPATPPVSPVLSAVQSSPDSSTPPPPPPPPPPHTGGDNGTPDSDGSSPDVLGRVLDAYAVRDVVVRQVNLRHLHDPLISARAALDLAPGGLTMRELALTDAQVLTVLAHHRHLSPEAVAELLKHPSYAAVLQHEDEAPQTS
ncbi:hypothetical protein [Streptomyces sp. NPDC053720]|uniref:hypothetical protein n=1 Tax=Streptomyces sp. NPDC053720 TaxID=3154855 RepID=UPI0034196C93